MISPSMTDHHVCAMGPPHCTVPASEDVDYRLADDDVKDNCVQLLAAILFLAPRPDWHLAATRDRVLSTDEVLREALRLTRDGRVQRDAG
jgi:hypothetical protein